MSGRIWIVAAALFAGCTSTDNGGMPGTDASVNDAENNTGDAGPCPGQLYFTGEYIDWLDPEGYGVLGAEVAEVGNSANSTTINAPNGRVELCLPAGTRSVVSFTHDDYVPVRYTVDPDSAASGAFSLKGLKRQEVDDFFALQLSGLVFDTQATQISVSVRTLPGGTPVSGAKIAIDQEHFGSFTLGVGDIYEMSDTLLNDELLLFANTAVVGARATVSVTPPTGTNCVGPAEIDIAVGEIAATTFACSQ